MQPQAAVPFDPSDLLVIGQRFVALLRQPIEIGLDRLQRIGKTRTVHQQRPFAGQAHAKMFNGHDETPNL